MVLIGWEWVLKCHRKIYLSMHILLELNLWWARGWWVVCKTKRSLSGFCFEWTWLASYAWNETMTGLETVGHDGRDRPHFPGIWRPLWFSGGWGNLHWKLGLMKKYGAWHFEPIISAARINFREDNSWKADFPHSLSVSQENIFSWFEGAINCKGLIDLTTASWPWE